MGEWTALVDDALKIREAPQDKIRRLRQLTRSIADSDLPPAEASALIERILLNDGD